MKEIKIKYFDGAVELKEISVGDWIDLYANEDVFIPVGGMKLVKLGVAMQLPKGYEAHVCPRSSTFKNWGIIQTNHTGIIDNSYCGDNDQWMYPAFCLMPNTDEYTPEGKHILGTRIKKGDKICQFRIMKNQPDIQFVKVDKLEGADRGGFGTTGTK